MNTRQLISLLGWWVTIYPKLSPCQYPWEHQVSASNEEIRCFEFPLIWSPSRRLGRWYAIRHIGMR